MKILYNSRKCISCGLCVSACPTIWTWGKYGKPILKNFEGEGADQEVFLNNDNPKVEMVAVHCPTGAIKLED
jgi:ferredoxin